MIQVRKINKDFHSIGYFKTNIEEGSGKKVRRITNHVLSFWWFMLYLCWDRDLHKIVER